MSAIECAFLGALGRDAKRKTSQAGKPYLRLNVRVGDDDAAQWVSVLAFDERAIEVATKLIRVRVSTSKAVCLQTNGPARTARNGSA